MNSARHVLVQWSFADPRRRPHPQPPTGGILKPLTVGNQNETRGANEDPDSDGKGKHKEWSTLPARVNNTFHVFTWLETVQAGFKGSADLDVEAITGQLQEVEEFLLYSTTMAERRAYNNCNWSSRKLVHAYLEDRGQELEDGNEKLKKKQDYEERVDLYNAADLVYRFFLPWRLDADAPTVGKFWGAISTLVEVSTERSCFALRMLNQTPGPRIQHHRRRPQSAI